MALMSPGPNFHSPRPPQLPHPRQPHHASAGEFDAQFERPASGFDEAAQGGKVEVGLALNLEHRGLLDAKALRDLILTALGQFAQGFKTLTLSLQKRNHRIPQIGLYDRAHVVARDD